ncbi:helix-turn-helix domain-containing protein [Paenibacillus whitsoniae]|uniref:XRE family transcriptional regulator n=1 Tax=Paenibacillus whitsoniae TaxID=2496558 RepID=A0A3S0A6X5_9BACL|nr:helix-turn-helix transcriptional regulator [Paenibacillus whitsoniae]RTE02763.1 XRE family transcriptional regulator [Paenibacillus whitsoniae]
MPQRKKNDFQVLVGAKIRVVRKSKGLSQKELADRADLIDTYVGSVERGERNVSLQSLGKIAGALGISPEELFQFQDVDVENDLYERKQAIEAHKALLLGRSLREIKMVHRIVKDMLGTFDAEKEGR